MFLRFFLIASILVLAKAAYAQPGITYWPDRGTSTQAISQQLNQIQATCFPPENTLLTGETVSFFLDPNGFFSDAMFVGTPSPAFGNATLQGDTLIFAATANLSMGGFDTLQIELVDSGGEISPLEFIVGVGLPGSRTGQTLTIAGGDVKVFGLNTPDGNLFCGCVINNGTYEFVDDRVARFTQFAPGDSLLYESSRGPGIDALLVVICDDFGTCDSTDITVTITGPTIELPFLDDFSEGGFVTDPRFWLDKDVFINDGFPLEAPSIGAATFDGIDANGQPYGVGFGQTDVLTSAFINLAPFDETSNIFLKYYYQIGGRGLAPEQNDELVVSGKTEDGTWVEFNVHSGSETGTTDDSFRFVSVPIDSAAFFHDEFQIRFEMFANLNGGLDVFNLDYVRVVQATDAGPDFRDIALSAPPSSILTPFTAIPFEQFEGRSSLIRSDVPVALFNHFGFQNNVSTSEIKVDDANDAQLLDAALLTAAQFNLDPGFTAADVTIPPAPLSTFRSLADGLDRASAKQLTTSYVLGIDQDQIGLEATLRNDTASTTVSIDDFYAYDDGSAELGLFNSGVGDVSLVSYDLFVADTLRGIRYAFPRLNDLDASSQLITIVVHIDSEGLGRPDEEPIYEQDFVRPFFPSDVGDSLQAFTTYRLEDSAGEPTELILQPGTFYVGWQQISDDISPIQVGLDLSNDNFDKVWSDFGFGFSRTDEFITDVEASLMIRPVFSTEELQNSSSTKDVDQLSLKLFPNPSRGQVQFLGLPDDAQNLRMEIYDLTGRMVEQMFAQPEINLNVTPGMYILQLKNEQGQQVYSERVIVY